MKFQASMKIKFMIENPNNLISIYKIDFSIE